MKGFVTFIIVLVILGFVFLHLGDIKASLDQMSIPSVPVAQAASKAILSVHQSKRSNLVMNVARLDQNSPSQYTDAAEFNAWSPSACAAASTAEVLNFYEGTNTYHVYDVLKVLRDNQDITSREGLLSYAAFGRVAAHYHYSAVLNEHDTLDHIISIANSGHPVIVNWPPANWPGGHFLVVRGGNASTVYLTDSSSFAYSSLSRSQFSNYWAGFSAVLTPKGGQ